MPDRARVKQIFLLALERNPAERPALLDRECGNDSALRTEVDSLLRAHDAPGPFMQDGPSARLSDALEATRGGGLIGRRVGAYRIVETLGSGGMGDVYKAVRDDDQYRAEVAIKLMRGDVRNPMAEQRFRTERQILAGLDHRNIARLLDGGTTPAGLPYVVMEFVDGVPIDRYCDEHALGARERVQLFLQVCAAVSYAHQHLVVHRDLKPGNILVTADGSAKLLDFGIAKLLDAAPESAPATDATVTRLRVMTLDYASPEQVSGSTVTTVSDVYSLGVVLYRLLTGASPYADRSSEAQRVAEILGDAIPTRPSLVRTSSAAHRREIGADLDNILLMALRKEPTRRYASVEQFAGDLRNYLSGFPVMARRGTFGYRFGKLVRRHKLPIAAATLAVLSLATGLGLALHEARIAQRHFDSVRQLANKLFDFHDAIAELPGATQAREMLVKTSLTYLDGLYQESSGDAHLQQELAIAYRKVGDIQGRAFGSVTGDTAAALASYGRSVALLEPLWGANPADHHIGAQLASSYVQQTLTLFYSKGPEPARDMERRTMQLLQVVADGFADDFERMSVESSARWARAAVEGSLGDEKTGLAALDEMLAVVNRYVTDHPEDDRGYNALASAYDQAASASDSTLTAEQNFPIELKRRQLALAANLKALELKAGTPKYQWSLAESRMNLGTTLCWHERCAEAVDYFREAAPVLAARAADSQDAQAQFLSLRNNNGLAWALFSAGRTSEAEPLLAANLKDAVALASRYDTLKMQAQLALARVHLGRVIAQSAAEPARWREARDLLAAGVASLRKINEAVQGGLYLEAEQHAAEATLTRVNANL